ncbi:MAG: hypothetical protein ACKVOK_12965, partial [Flavobacteriales bacterium]
MRSFAIIFLSILSVSFMSAQKPVDEGLQVLYKKEAYGGVSLNMNGYGAFFTYAKYKSAYKLNLYN